MTKKDIVERLRAHDLNTSPDWADDWDRDAWIGGADELIEESATEIESLRTREREAQDRYKATEDELRATEAKLARVERRNVELEEALRPFAAVPYSGANAFNRAALSDDDFRAARRALGET